MDTNSQNQIELPKYQCHKVVHALKIAKLVEDNEDRGRLTLFPENTAYQPFELDAEYVEKHKPVVGGYYVVYEDGYKSFSPAKAFESGYTLMK